MPCMILYNAVLINLLIMFQINLAYLRAQWLKFCISGFIYMNVNCRSSKSWSQMIVPDMLLLLQRFCNQLMKTTITLKFMFFWWSFTLLMEGKKTMSNGKNKESMCYFRKRKIWSKVNVWYGLMHNKVIRLFFFFHHFSKCLPWHVLAIYCTFIIRVSAIVIWQ